MGIRSVSCWAAGLALVLGASAGRAAAVDLPSVPEIDGGSIASALALLLGGTLLLTDRLRHK